MSLTLMLAPTQQTLTHWQNEWCKAHIDEVESVNTPAGYVALRNGDVYLWRVVGANNLRGLRADAVVVHARRGLFTGAQFDEIAALRTRVR